MSRLYEEVLAALRAVAQRLDRIETAAREPERALWRAAEFAARTGLSYDTVLDKVHAGDIACVQQGRLLLIPESEVQRLASLATEQQARRAAGKPVTTT